MLNHDDIADLDTDAHLYDQNHLSEITSWKLEAKLEDTSRYFYNLSEVKEIMTGRKCFIVGRKGCGKTAISEHILSKNNNRDNIFVSKLTFKNFPFNDLYDLSNNRYTAPNQYITLWKYLIYSYICKLMIKNSRIDYDTSRNLREVFPERDDYPLRRLVPRWTAKEFALNILGLGGKISGDQSKIDVDWSSRVDILEDFLLNSAEGSAYYVMIDELDEDYREILTSNTITQYFHLLTGLFKAVQDIRSIFRDNKYKIFPVVFIRDDIYSLILDSDKTKWTDFRRDLDWDKEQIRNLVGFRLCRAVDPKGNEEFSASWGRIFMPTLARVGQGGANKIPIFDYITRATHLRPRDYIQYIKVAAEEAINRNHNRIGPKEVQSVDKAFSNYLRSELSDEMQAGMPDIKQIFEIISSMRRQIFSIDEFRNHFNDHKIRGALKTTDADFALTSLFHFSAIGNINPKTNMQFFRYNHREARLNFKEKIVVHRGLLKSLQIL